MISWPDNLIKDIAKRQCVLFLGSGISANAFNDNGDRPRTWKQFLLFASEKVTDSDKKNKIIEKINTYDFLMACELLKKTLNDEFYQILLESFQKPKFNVADMHKSLFKLDTRIVVTPNFDEIYDTYARSESRNTVVVKNYYDEDIADSIRSADRLILKIHGSIATPQKLIFTHTDYAKARTHAYGFYQLLQALILTQPFLFIGAGLSDPDIKLMLENYSYQFRYSQKHIFIIPDGDYSQEELDVYEDSLKVKFLKFSKADDYKELKDSILNLVEKVDTERNLMANNQSW